MRILFVGVGSIGTRHIRDFYNTCCMNHIIPEIFVLRRQIGSLDKSIENMVSGQLTDSDELESYDAVFITNPTSLHYEILKKINRCGKYYFIEKPIFDNINHNYKDLGLASNNTYVAAPMRHTKIFRTLQKIVNSERVYSSRIICSSYLPDWRPNIDYRKSYSAIKNMGGGVCLDLVHEIDYMIGLFGVPKNSHCYHGKYSHLEILSDDLSVYIVEYDDMLCEVHLDYFGRKYRRTCEVFTQEGTYIADFYNEQIQKPNGEIIDCKEEKDAEFKNEMRYFFDFISGSGEVVNDPELAMITLKIALGE